MTDSSNPRQPLDSNALLKKYSRREFLKTASKAAAAGAVAASGSWWGMGRLEGGLNNVVLAAEQEILRLGADVKALSGAVEQKLKKETDALEVSFTNGQLLMYEKMGIASPAEIKDFEEIIKNSREFEEHYGFAERATIFKDRLDQRLLAIDQVGESYQPEFWRVNVNDSIRSIFGQPTGQAGAQNRREIKDRIDELVKVYDANEDNRIAQGKVLEKINGYLRLTKEIPSEEKELYAFVKEHIEAGPEKVDRVKDFLLNYNKYEGRNDALIAMRTNLTRAQNLYAKIKENKEYALTFQGYLKEGIALKEKIRSQAPKEFAKHRKTIDTKVSELRGQVDQVIAELKGKGYDIETRQDYINSGQFSTLFRDMYSSAKNWATGIAGFTTAFLVGRSAHKNSKVRAGKSALDEAVGAYNNLLKEHNRATSPSNEGESQ